MQVEGGIRYVLVYISYKDRLKGKSKKMYSRHNIIIVFIYAMFTQGCLQHIYIWSPVKIVDFGNSYMLRLVWYILISMGGMYLNVCV